MYCLFYSLKFIHYQISSILIQCLFSVLESDPRYHIIFNDHVSLGSSSLRQFPRLYRFLMSLIVQNIAQVFCRTSHSGDLSEVFSRLDWGYVFWKERPLRKSVIFITSYQDYKLSTNVSVFIGGRVYPISPLY